jgi:hypothetical protein
MPDPDPPAAPVLSVDERLALHELAARYANILDRGEFGRAGEVFTVDAVYDLEDLGYGVIVGAEAIAAFWERSGDHPLAHHSTDVEAWRDRDGTVRIYSKILGVGAGGRVGSVVYRDVAVATPQGWRLTLRVGQLRRPP